MIYGLTKVQSECLAFIETFSGQHGFAPTYVEIAQALGYASKSNIHRIISRLEERGYLKRLPAHSRTLVLVERA